MTSEIVALKEADRAIKAAAKDKARVRPGSATRGKAAVRKVASGRGAGARGAVRR
jgi:hypothetical protein